jgi:probable rRNA maturation factor
MVVEVYSEHSDGSLFLTSLEELALHILAEEGWSFNVSVILVDDEELRRLNILFLSSDSYTDVIAFQSDEDEEYQQEIYISFDQARHQATEAGETIQKSLHRLLVHGILHLGGWHDATAAEKQKMLDYGERYVLLD